MLLQLDDAVIAQGYLYSRPVPRAESDRQLDGAVLEPHERMRGVGAAYPSCALRRRAQISSAKPESSGLGVPGRTAGPAASVVRDGERLEADLPLADARMA